MFPKDTKTIMELLYKNGNDAKIPYPIAFKITQKDLELFEIKNNMKLRLQGCYKNKTVSLLESERDEILSLLINRTAGKLIPKVISYFEKGVLYHITWLQDVTQQDKMSHSFYDMKYNSIKNEYKIYIPGHIHKITYYNSENANNHFRSSSYAGLP